MWRMPEWVGLSYPILFWMNGGVRGTYLGRGVEIVANSLTTWKYIMATISIEWIGGGWVRRLVSRPCPGISNKPPSPHQRIDGGIRVLSIGLRLINKFAGNSQIYKRENEKHVAFAITDIFTGSGG